MENGKLNIAGIFGGVLIAAMMGYGIFISFTHKDKKQESMVVEESIHPSIASMEEESIMSERPVQSEPDLVKQNLTENQLAILNSFEGDRFFEKLSDSALPLNEEHRVAVRAGDNFRLNISAANVKFIFTQKVEQDVIVHLRFYRKSDKTEPTLKLMLTERELELGVTMKSWSLPDNFKIAALVYLPTDFKELKINSSASEYLLEGESKINIGNLEIDTNASEGVIKLTRLEVDELKLKVNAAATKVELDELLFNKRLYISNNAAGLKFKATKLGGSGKNIEIDQNASGSDFEFSGLDNLFINGDINLGSVSISKDGTREVYKKSFNYTMGEQERVMIINTNLGAVNLEF